MFYLYIQILTLSGLVSSGSDQVQTMEADGRNHVALNPHLARIERRRERSIHDDFMVKFADMLRRRCAEGHDATQAIPVFQTRRDYDHRSPFNHFWLYRFVAIVAHKKRTWFWMKFKRHSGLRRSVALAF
jgi:hypothetical protein